MQNLSSSIQILLSNFKSIVELVIKFPGDSLTNQYGAIERIRVAILSILSHGLKQGQGDVYDNLWPLIVRLNANSQKHINLLQDVYHHDDLRSTVEQWIDQSMITQCLSSQLSAVEIDSDILDSYYDSYAFMRIRPFFHAFMICIRTIEYSDPSLLANIDPKLSIAGFDHATPSGNEITCRSYSSTTPPTLTKNLDLSSDDNQQKLSAKDKQRIFHRRIHSDPVFHFEDKSNNLLHVASSYLLNDIQLNQEDNISTKSYSIEYGSSYDLSKTSSLSIEQSLPNDTPRDSTASQRTITNIENKHFHQSIRPTISIESTTSSTFLPYSSLLWPRRGQTLDNYIQEYDSQTGTDVEKENAHLYFSEAIISAIEYMKFSQECQKQFETVEDNSVPLNKLDRDPNLNINDLSAESLALTILESWKNHKIPVASDLFWMIPHEDDISDELTSIHNSGVNDQGNDHASIGSGERILRRGNSQWAPPREQLIFHIHQTINRDIQLKKQDNLCAGCGRDAGKGSVNRFRYCEYTGKYFCRSCHEDKKFYLPSYIITKWDFSNKHTVSNFAYDYLNRIYNEPIFDLNDLNPKLFERSNKLRIVNELRWALYSLRYYIFTCRFAEEQGFQKTLSSLPSYVYDQPHTYSLQDLVKTKFREFPKILEPVFTILRDHALTCPLCRAKGFICEICNNDKSIIFPFNIQTTSVCPVCQSCYHIQCHKNYKYVCPKCQRNKHRSLLSPSSRS